mgnify:CR=1 FL=1
MNKYGIYNSFYSKLTMFQIKINIETSDEKKIFFNDFQLYTTFTTTTTTILS